MACEIGFYHLSPKSVKYQSTVYQTEVVIHCLGDKAREEARPKCPDFLWENQLVGHWITVVNVLWNDSLWGLSQTPHYAG